MRDTFYDHLSRITHQVFYGSSSVVAGDGWLAWAVAFLVYPGLLAAGAIAFMAEVLLELVRTGRLRSLAGLQAPLRRPSSGAGSSWGFVGEALLAGWSMAAPLLALLLMPVPAHPLILAAQANDAIPLTGSTTAILLLAGSGPLALAAIGLGSARVGAQIGGARLARQAGLSFLPVGLAFSAIATAGGSTDLGVAVAASAGAPSGGLVRLLAALALLATLPAIGQWPPADAAGPDPLKAGANGALAGLNGPPLFFARVGVLLQRAALLALWVLLAVPGAAASRREPGAPWLFVAALPLAAFILALFGARVPAWKADTAAAIALYIGGAFGLLALILATFGRG